MTDKIYIPYLIEQVSKTKYQGKIFLTDQNVTLELEPTTKGRCAKRLCTRLMPLLVDAIEENWPDELASPPDVPETTAAARDRQLETLPPDTGAVDEMASRKFPPPREEKAESPHPQPARGLDYKPRP